MECGYSIDRDWNAALNIEHAPTSGVGVEATSVASSFEAMRSASEAQLKPILSPLPI